MSSRTSVSTDANAAGDARAADGCTPTVETTVHEEMMITVGRLVNVASRTWPGINKPGGIARVTFVHEQHEGQDQELLVDVSYIVGRSKERRVPIEYVQLAPEYELGDQNQRHNEQQQQQQQQQQQSTPSIRPSGLRDRSLIMGRCRRCGSLRTDCGSCDWATEEAAELHNQQQSQQPQQPHQEHPSRKRYPAKHSTPPMALEESRSSSSDEDEVVLRELFRTGRTNFRRHMKNRRRFNAIFGSTETDPLNASADSSVESAEATSTSAIKEKDDEESDDDDEEEEEEDVEELLQQSQRLFRQHSRKRKKWKRRLEVIQRQERNSLRGKWKSQHSVLETLAAPTIRRKEKGTDRARRVMLDGQTANYQEHDATTLRTNQSTPSESQQEDDSAGVDDCSVFGNETMTQVLSPTHSAAVDDDHNDDASLNQMHVKDLQRRAASYLNDPDDSGLNHDPDDIFIQPEGNEAAENLPSDMVDRTKGLVFLELPEFFNHICDDVENNLVPDYALRIAKLEREQRRLVSRRGVLSQYPVDATILLQDCSTLYHEMERKLIREGLDQCSLALKKISDDKLFRQIRKQLSPEQRKKIRSSAVMDARNLRLDALEEAAMDLVRKLRNLSEILENLMVNDEATDDDHPMTFDGRQTHEMPSDREFDGATPSAAALTASLLHPSERELGPFDPHQHASRVRKSKRGTTDARHELRDPKRERGPKRAKGPVQGTTSIHDFIEDDLPRTKRANPRSSHSTQVAFSNRSDSIETTSSFGPLQDHANIDHVDCDKTDDEEQESQVTEIFRHEANEEFSKAFEQSSSRRVGTRIRRTTTHQWDSLVNPPLDTHSHDVNRPSISHRMQAFLDKNSDLDIGDDDRDASERTSGRSSRQDIRGCRSQRQKDREFGLQSRQDGRIETENVHSVLSAKESDIGIREYLLSKLESSSCEVSPLAPLAPSSSRFDGPFRSRLDQLPQGFDKDAVRTNERVSSSESTAHVSNLGNTQQIHRNSSEMTPSHLCATLLELLAHKRHRLGAYVQLFTTLVKSGSEIIFGGTREQFLSLLVFQLVDAVYALVHPTAWSLKGVDRVCSLQLLEPLRDALAHCVSLTEAVCRCIIEQLRCQEWKIGGGGEVIYLSGFEPSCWARFVECGGYSIPAPPESRFQKLGKVWPRVEIETAWNVLLFFGSAQHKVDQTKQARWQLVTKLFSSNVLARSSGDDPALPPSAALLTAFEFDLDNFGHLVRQGAMDDLPTTDTLLFNLSKMAIVLQAKDYIGNEESRFRSFPIFGTHRKVKQLLSRLWNTTESLMNLDLSESHERWLDVHETMFHLSSSAVFTQDNDLLLPTSRLFATCLSLIVAWSGHVPKKKVRQARFLKSLKALRESLPEIEHDVMVQNTGVSTTNDPFANAFGESMPIEVGAASERVSVFIAEAKCYLLILESICSTCETTNTPNADGLPRHCGLSHATMIEMWNLVSNDGLDIVRQMLLDGSIGSFIKPTDPMKVFVAGKIMSTAAFLCLGISPWKWSVSDATLWRLYVNADEHKQAIDYYAFPVSCIFACIASLSEHCPSSAPLCRLLAVITVLFNRLTAIIRREGTDTTMNRLGAHCDSIYLPVLTRCFRRHVNSSTDDVECKSLFRVILAAIRAVAAFQGVRLIIETEANESMQRVDVSVKSGMRTTITTRDDCFDDLDDSFYASLDTGMSSIANSRASIPAEHHWAWIINALAAVADLSIRPHAMDGGDIFMSATAKYLLRLEIDKICDCLLSLAIAQRGDESKELWEKLVTWIKQSQRNDIDTEIETKISKRLSMQICLMACKHAACRSIIEQNFELILFGIFRALLDCNRLESLPSCNFATLIATEGECAIRHALAAIDVFNGNLLARPNNVSPRDFERLLESQRKRKQKVAQPWGMIDSLGIAVKQNQLSVAVFLHDPDHDLTSPFDRSISSACLEQEAFSCFVLLRNAITTLSKQEIEISLYESMSGNILILLASEILRVVHGLKYFDLTNQGIALQGDDGPKRGKIVTLLHCVSELFISVAAWILRSSRSDVSSGWKSIQTQLCDRIFYPLLRRGSFDIASNLGLLVETCRSAVPHLMVSGSTATTAMTGCSKYFDHCYDMVIRRCHQLISAPVMVSVLMSHMIEGLNAAERDLEIPLSELIGKSFEASSPISAALPRGPLEEEVDHYLSVVESNMPTTDGPLIATLKRFDALKYVIIPKLLQKHTNLNAKRRVLRIVSYMLTDQQALVGSSMNDSDLLQLLASLVRGIFQSLIECMRTSCVDDALISAALTCAGNLARLSLLDSLERQKATLSFCDDEVAQIDFSDLSILCNTELRAMYLHTFFRWMLHFSGSLLDSAAISDDVLSALRRLCTKKKLVLADDSVVRDSMIRRDDGEVDGDLETWTNVFASVEDKLFGSKSENVPPVVNVYAKTRTELFSTDTKEKGDALELWKPPSHVTRSATEYMTIFISYSS